MDGEPIPDCCGRFRAEDSRQCRGATDVEVADYQVDRLIVFHVRVRKCRGYGDLDKLTTRTTGVAEVNGGLP
jgi:hypothetical protein